MQPATTLSDDLKALKLEAIIQKCKSESKDPRQVLGLPDTVAETEFEEYLALKFVRAQSSTLTLVHPLVVMAHVVQSTFIGTHDEGMDVITETIPILAYTMLTGYTSGMEDTIHRIFRNISEEDFSFFLLSLLKMDTANVLTALVETERYDLIEKFPAVINLAEIESLAEFANAAPRSQKLEALCERVLSLKPEVIINCYISGEFNTKHPEGEESWWWIISVAGYHRDFKFLASMKERFPKRSLGMPFLSGLLASGYQDEDVLLSHLKDCNDEYYLTPLTEFAHSGMRIDFGIPPCWKKLLDSTPSDGVRKVLTAELGTLAGIAGQKESHDTLVGDALAGVYNKPGCGKLVIHYIQISGLSRSGETKPNRSGVNALIEETLKTQKLEMDLESVNHYLLNESMEPDCHNSNCVAILEEIMNSGGYSNMEISLTDWWVFRKSLVQRLGPSVQEEVKKLMFSIGTARHLDNRTPDRETHVRADLFVNEGDILDFKRMCEVMREMFSHPHDEEGSIGLQEEEEKDDEIPEDDDEIPEDDEDDEDDEIPDSDEEEIEEDA